VSYEVRGPLRDILICHCEECRRSTGYLGAFAATPAESLVVHDGRALRWIDSPQSDRGARRGFCAECGSSLFWEAAEGARVNIAVGTLDRPTGLRIAGHWYAHQADDWDELPEDAVVLSSADDVSRMRWTPEPPR
jgi:hypothetical protein